MNLYNALQQSSSHTARIIDMETCNEIVVSLYTMFPYRLFAYGIDVIDIRPESNYYFRSFFARSWNELHKIIGEQLIGNTAWKPLEWK